MKLNLQFLVGVLSLASLCTAFGQGTFQNLDFESPVFVTVAGSPFLVEADPVLAGWTAYIGATDKTQFCTTQKP